MNTQGWLEAIQRQASQQAAIGRVRAVGDGGEYLVQFRGGQDVVARSLTGTRHAVGDNVIVLMQPSEQMATILGDSPYCAVVTVSPTSIAVAEISDWAERITEHEQVAANTAARHDREHRLLSTDRLGHSDVTPATPLDAHALTYSAASGEWQQTPQDSIDTSESDLFLLMGM